MKGSNPSMYGATAVEEARKEKKKKKIIKKSDADICIIPIVY